MPSAKRNYVWALAVAAVLAGAAVLAFRGPHPYLRDKQAHAHETAAVLAHSAVQYRATHDRCPAMVVELLPAAGLDGAIDPWGRQYVVQCDEYSVSVGSFGQDGMPGGTEASADIFVRQ